MSGQPEFFPDRVLTKEEAGLGKEIPAGAPRLLAELVKRGLREEHLHAAATICLVLDEGALDER
jgi:hypothetical protein